MFINFMSVSWVIYPIIAIMVVVLVLAFIWYFSVPKSKKSDDLNKQEVKLPSQVKTQTSITVKSQLTTKQSQDVANKKLQNEMLEQKRKAEIKERITTLQKTICALYKNKEILTITENFIKSGNRYLGIETYVLPKKDKEVNRGFYKEKFRVPLFENIQDVDFLIKQQIYDENDVESVVGKDMFYILEKALLQYKLIKNEPLYIKNMVLNKGCLDVIDDLYYGIKANGISIKCGLYEFCFFVGVCMYEYNHKRYQFIANKYDLSSDDLEIGVALSSTYSKTEIDTERLYGLIDMVREKGGSSDDISEMLHLLIKSYYNCSQEECDESAMEYIKGYNDRLKLKKKVANYLKSVEPNNLTIADIDGMNGQEFEKTIAGLFERKGYNVEITKGSGDQGIDIIARRAGKCIGIQAKCYTGAVGNHAIMEAVGGMKYYDCDSCMVITNSTFTKSALELARVNDVELWNRTILIDNLNEMQ